MKLSALSLEIARKAARLASFAFALTVVGVSSAYAQTAKPEASASVVYTPHSDITYSTITDSNNTVNLSRVPTVDANDGIHYWDVSLLFDTDAEGNLTLAAGYPVVTPSSSYVTGGFKAGTYVGPSTVLGGNAIIAVSGPSLLSGGGTAWTLSTPSGANAGTYPNSAMWYVEAAANTPLAARIKAAGITTNQYYFGSGNTLNDQWFPNSLLGFSQVGNTITIVCFTGLGADNDYPVPQDQITYTLK